MTYPNSLSSLDFSDFNSLRLSVASKDDMLAWSYGEVIKSETINYRTQKPEKDGLFCERIFGPVKDINPHDTRYKGARSRNMAVDKKGAIVTKAIVRRERMGHISLAAPVVHILFLRVAPSPLSAITGMTVKALEKVIYFASYIILDVDDKTKSQLGTSLTDTYKDWHKLFKEQSQAISIDTILDYFMKLKSDEDFKSYKFDFFKLLPALNTSYASQPKLIVNLEKHELIDHQRREIINQKFGEVWNFFQVNSHLKTTKSLIKIYQDFLASKEDKSKASELDLTTELKADFRKLTRLLDGLSESLEFSDEQMSDIYQLRLKQLKNDLVINELIIETDYRNLPLDYQKIVRVAMGGEALQEILKSTNLDKLIKDLNREVDQTKGQKRQMLLKRLKVLEGMQNGKINVEDFCLTVVPVIPPNLRPIIQLSGGRFVVSDLNDLYRIVINRNNRLKDMQQKKAPEIICRNEKRMLQEAVDALIDNTQQRGSRIATTGSQQRKLKSLADNLKRKQGRLRQNLLGKTVDYSGRSVIVSGPQLNILECGLPKVMALELFKPFVIGYLINNDYANNPPSAKRLIELGDDAVWDALDQVIKGKYVLLNRAPSLHRLSIQAFKPKLIEGKAIQLHPLVCKGFNADFDGDTMAVHLPLSREAQKEAASLMIAPNNLLHPANGTPILYLDQDIIMGLYYLTYLPADASDQVKFRFNSVDEAVMAYEQDLIKLQTWVEIKFRNQRHQTTLGRVLFNEILPEDFQFQNLTLGKKPIKEVMSKIYDAYDNKLVAQIANEMKNLAFEYATQSGYSVGMGDFTPITDYKHLQQQGIAKVMQINQQHQLGYITDSEKYRLITQNWFDIDQEIEQIARKQFISHKDSALMMIVDSEARGGVNIRQIKQLMVSVGVTNDASGQPLELSINSNYFDGLPTLEYFISTRGSRKSLIDVALSTADSGYLSRRLVYVAQDVITVDDDPQLVDPGFEIFRSDCQEIDASFGQRLVHRYSAEDLQINDDLQIKIGQLITKQIAQTIEDSDISSFKIMSSLSCPQVKNVPIKSYGIDLANGLPVKTNQAIGIVAAQSIGEPSTQLKLDSKHGGGIATTHKRLVHIGLNRIDELFEARPPKGEAFLAPFKGQISITKLNYDYDVQLKADTSQALDIKLDQAKPLVKADQVVKQGDILALKSSYEVILSPCDGMIESLDSQAIKIKLFKPLSVKFSIPISQYLFVKDQEVIEAGTQINEGSVRLQEILDHRSIIDAQRYLIIEILKVFAEEGQNIAEKHLEVIIRQMFRLVQVIDPGNSQFREGDVISVMSLAEENNRLIKASKNPILWKQLVAGVTKVISSADGFLVSAGHQDTIRTLINAAVQSQVDTIDGVIENIILGRRIPVSSDGRVID
ncbi:MAG: DNA-directed RNA polymerase subunit beta' [Candidatus Saccharibacteria bacterium]|nr:DNA-directed RNA polymerase subunit beta' [Candidatus Saccharibacteria bacterium]